jgi:hypothetical protein
MGHDPWFCRGIPLWAASSIGTSSGCEYTHAVTVATNDVGLIEGDPMFYSVSKGFEADPGIAFVVGDYIAGE